jgi:hypothetical protein
MNPHESKNDTMAVERSASQSPEDFILQEHDGGERLSKEEIARRYALAFHGRSEPSREDMRFVDQVLTNPEG